MNLTESTFKQEAVIIALKKLFDDSFFNISHLHNISILTETTIPADKQRIFQTLHCIHYNTMSREFREDLAEMIHNLFKDFFELESNKVKFREVIKTLEHKK